MKNTVIYPELGQTTKAQIEYRCGYRNTFYATTDLELSGRGITKSGSRADHKRRLQTYSVTEHAFNKLKKEYTTCFIASL